MILKAIIEDQVYELNVPDALIEQAGGYFDQLDRDMDRGWQMSRDWVAEPDSMQRCQIVADKLLTALESENEKLGLLMAGYILARLPNVESVELDTHGEMQSHHFNLGETSAAAPRPSPVGDRPAPMSKLEAMERAGRDVTTVFKDGRGYRFSVLEPESGSWLDSPTIATAEEAARLRQQAFKERYESLLGGAVS